MQEEEEQQEQEQEEEQEQEQEEEPTIKTETCRQKQKVCFNPNLHFAQKILENKHILYV